MGQVGFGVDTILEMRVVTASGEARTVTASQDPDLFWAMRGAGPNFGIVTSATVKAYPVAKDDRYAWCGALIYTDDKLERVVEAIQNLDLSARMVVFMYFCSSGPPSHAAMIIVTPWLYQGTAESGKAAFKTLYDIGPMVENTSVLPYTEWNTGANPFCAKDERKPACGAGLDRLDPQAWREVWDKYTEFQKKPSAQASVVLMEAYPLNDKRFADDVVPASFPYRGVRFNAAILPWYTDAGLDGEGLQCAKNIRELWTKSSGREVNAT
jgi:FAD/FMN-containing dehydrogenase